jgi:biopolymer transport protein ExbD
VDKSITLPIAQNAAKRDNARDESIINVRWDPAKKQASYLFEDKPYDRLEPIVPMLTQRQNASHKHRLVIRGDRLVPAEQISLAMAAAASAGIADITFAASPR